MQSPELRNSGHETWISLGGMRYAQCGHGNLKSSMVPIALPTPLQVGQASDVGSSVTVSVRTLSARKYIRISLNTFEQEAEFFSDASACLITTRVRETDSPHSERAEGITHQCISCLRC